MTAAKKIFNDPVYGFITIPYDIVFWLIEHPYFQRLRRIKQLGLTHYVYPGALHTRFQHALGALHLTSAAIETLRSKGHRISDEEAEAVCIAVLLHDIGHGPFSHTLEYALLAGVSHEQLSGRFMEVLNRELGGRLNLALAIFRDEYPRRFLHKLVASQLDMDRLDYLNRDSFFTGVHEGIIGSERIIKMLNVSGDDLVIDAKGIYSIDKFIVARRIMYWQVYLHKTVISAEQMLIKALMRAKKLVREGKDVYATPFLKPFLTDDGAGTADEKEYVDRFSKLDDFEIMVSVKVWAGSEDKVLAFLGGSLINRRLLKVEMSDVPVTDQRFQEALSAAMKEFGISSDDAGFLAFRDSTSNSAYRREGSKINIITREGRIRDITDASGMLDSSVIKDPELKYYLCYPKQLKLT